MPSAVRHTRTVPPSPLMMTGVPSGSIPAATAFTLTVPTRPWDQLVCQGRSGAALATRAARLRQPS